MNTIRATNVTAWSFRDLVVVSGLVLIVVFTGSIVYLLTERVCPGAIYPRFIIRSAVAILTGAIPVYWVRTRYGFGIRELGIVRVSQKTAIYCVISIPIALCIAYAKYSLSDFIVPWGDIFSQFRLVYIFSAGFMLSCILVPVGEELLFRGLIARFFVAKYGVSLGIIFQAVIFGLFHFSIGISLGIFVVEGVLLGLLFAASESLFPSILAHSLLNLITQLGRMANNN